MGSAPGKAGVGSPRLTRPTSRDASTTEAADWMQEQFDYLVEHWHRCRQVETCPSCSRYAKVRKLLGAGAFVDPQTI